MKHKILLSAVFALAIFSGCKKDISPLQEVQDMPVANFVNSNAAENAANDHVPNELLVKFKANSTENGRTKALARIGGKQAEKILTKAMLRSGDKNGIYVIHTPLAVFEAINNLKGDDAVEFAEPNFIYQHTATSNDPYYTNGSLWGMSTTNQNGSRAGTAWANNNIGSATVFIGIIDEGAMYDHEDLQGNFGNPGETPGDGIDNDGNGFVDDKYGWDFDGNNNSTFDGTGDDHGTHVAGTIGAKGGNGKGVAGVVWNVKMISAKFLGRNGGTTANAIKSVDYFTDLKVNRGINIVATNNSWGGGGFSQALQDAITRAENANILFIAAAGNDGANTETSTSYPSGYNNANIIAVASITSTGAISSFSNYAATKVDIGAPGSGINSTLPASSKGKIISSYGSYSGTSMATPHVTGAAALYVSSNPTATAAQIKAAILGSAIATSSLTGRCVTGGRLNVSGF